MSGPEPDPVSDAVDATPPNPTPSDGALPEAVDPTPEESHHAWGRLRWMAGPRPTRGKLLVAALALVLGFAVSTQIRQTRTQDLDTLRQSDLIGILDTVSQRAVRLADEADSLARTRDQLAGGQAGSRAAVTAAQERLRAMEVLAGTVPVHGPGVVIRIDDPGAQLEAATILDVVQELRDAGAEAIQVGPVRVVASTAFTDVKPGTVAAGPTSLTFPVTILAVGDPQTLAGAMNIPGGAVDATRQQGASLTVTPESAVAVRALHAVTAPRYAQPVPATTSAPTP